MTVKMSPKFYFFSHPRAAFPHPEEMIAWGHNVAPI
jgi:hypothetical protein